MGADGGVTWMRVSDHKRFWELVRPLGFTDVWGTGTGHADDHIHHIDEYGDEFGLTSEHIILPYGTDVELQGFSDIRNMLLEADSIEEFFYGGRIMTFAEILLDCATRNDTWWDDTFMYLRPKNTIERALWCEYNFSILVRTKNFERLNAAVEDAQQDALLSRPILEWARELKNLLNPKSFGMAETWT